MFDLGVPVLGICYGEQTMVNQLGGEVTPANEREFGRADIEIVADTPLFEGFGGPGTEERVWMSHGDRVHAIPEGFEVIAKTQNAPFAAIADESRHFYGVQFHPEVSHTPRGAAPLKMSAQDSQFHKRQKGLAQGSPRRTWSTKQQH